jgi:site-specific DNA recombinase
MKKQLQRGVIYYRVSTAEQAERGFSLENQREACLKYAKNKGIDVIAKFHDDGLSAKTTNRKGLQQMLQYCSTKNNKIDCVIVNKVDRLSRDVNDYTSIFTQLKGHGITLISTTEAIDNTPFGKCVGNIMATFAQLDNDMRSERVTAGIKKCIESGRWPFKARIGYLNYTDADGIKSIVVDPKKAPLVRTIFNEFAKGIYTEEEIRQKVNEKGLRTKTGKEISAQLIHKILCDKFYISIMTMHGIEYPASHESIISNDIFYQCQKFMKKYDKSTNMSLQKKNEAFPLRNFVLCGECTRPLTASFSTSHTGKKFPYYRCYNKQCNAPKSLPKNKLESEFFDFLKEITPDKRYLKVIRHMALELWEKKYKELNTTNEQIQREIEVLKEKKRKTFDLLGKGIIDDDDFKEELDRIKLSIEDKEELLHQTPREDFDLAKAMDTCFDFFLHIPEYWKKAKYTQKIQLQGSIFSKNPSYHYPKFGTPNFSLIFGQKKDFAHAKSLLVAPRGIEPLFSG